MNALDLWSRHVSVPLSTFELDAETLSVIKELVTQYFPQSYADLDKSRALSANKGIIINYIVSKLDDLSESDAESLLYSVDSFNRPELLKKLASCVSGDAWLRLFRQVWTQCDSCSLYHEDFKYILNTYSLDRIKSFAHDESDTEFYNSLPETFEVYRGTFIDSRFAGGISWTTDRSIAEKFETGYKSFANNGPMAYRYRVNMSDEKFDLLKDIATSGTTVLTRTVNKADIFVNTSRGESEILVIN